MGEAAIKQDAELEHNLADILIAKLEYEMFLIALHTDNLTVFLNERNKDLRGSVALQLVKLD